MNKYTYKLQGNGRDSWVCEEPDGNSYMVYENPFDKKVDISNIDIDSLTDEQILKLKSRFEAL